MPPNARHPVFIISAAAIGGRAKPLTSENASLSPGMQPPLAVNHSCRHAPITSHACFKVVMRQLTLTNSYCKSVIYVIYIIYWLYKYILIC